MPEPARPDPRSSSEIVSDAIENVRDIFRYEIGLAKVEVGKEVKKAGKAATGMAIGAVLLINALSFALVTIFLGIAHAVPYWVSALIMTVVLGVVGGILFGSGRKKLKTVNPKPQDTIQTLKEDVRWAREQRKSVRRGGEEGERRVG